MYDDLFQKFEEEKVVQAKAHEKLVIKNVRTMNYIEIRQILSKK